MNVLVVGDKHLPFEHRNYLDFCFQTYKKFKCRKVVDIGDTVDFHAISRHDHDPDGFSPKQELEKTKEKLKLWKKAFPKVDCCIGNHDERLEKAAVKYGLSRAYFKSFKELFEFPEGWEYGFEYQYFGVRFFHGTGYGGKHGHVNAAIDSGQSVVIGHLHANAGIEYVANQNRLIFGMAVGCGIDYKSYAFNYGRDFRRKPILSCGVVFDGGLGAQVVPMKI